MPLTQRLTILIMTAVFILFSAVVFYEGWHRELGDHDGYQFLAQARRITDPNYSSIPFNWQRPRGLVMIFGLFDFCLNSVLGRFPRLNEYYTVMAAISILCVGVWWKAGVIWFGREAAALGAVLFMSYPSFSSLVTTPLSDIFTTLLWGVCVWLFRPCLHGVSETNTLNRTQWVLLGTFGAMAALSKYQYFFLLPCLLLSCFFWLHKTKLEPYQWKRVVTGSGWAALSFVITVECVQRFFGSFREGFWYTIKLYYQVSNDTMRGAGQPLDPWYVYIKQFWQEQGALMVLLFTGGLWCAIRRLIKAKWSAEKIGLVILSSVFCLFALWIQVTPHREARYLLPMVPGIFLISCWGGLEFFKKWKVWQRCMGSALFFVAIIYPIRASINIHSSHLRQIGHYERDQIQNFLNYLGISRDDHERCQWLAACDFNVSGHRFDYPMYQFFLPWLSPHIIGCRQRHPEHRSLKNELLQGFGGHIIPKTCLVLPGTQGGILVQKIVDPLMRDSKGRDIRCEGKTAFHCYKQREFFDRADIKILGSSQS